MTPFEAIYGKKPSLILSYMSGVFKAQEMDNTLTVHAAILRTIKKKNCHGSKSHETTRKSGLFRTSIL
jgi:hypothetical protein